MPPRKKGKKLGSGESKDDQEGNLDAATDILSPSEVVKMRKKSQPPQQQQQQQQQQSQPENETESEPGKEKEKTSHKLKTGKNLTKSSKKDKDKLEGDSKKKDKQKRSDRSDSKEPEHKKMKGAKEKRKQLNKKRSQDGEDVDRKFVLYPCGICTKEVVDSDEAILCEAGCEFWYHRKCAGMTDIAYHLLTKEDHAEWVCDKCIATKSVPLVKMKSVLEASA